MFTRRVAKVERRAHELYSQYAPDPFFMLGLGLYWADGTKSLHNSGLSFSNTDARTHQLMMRWFERFLFVGRGDYRVHMLVHIGHAQRETLIRDFWCRELEISLDTFQRTSWIRAPWKKAYENDSTYHGVVSLRIRRSKDRLRIVRAWIACLANRSY